MRCCVFFESFLKAESKVSCSEVDTENLRQHNSSLHMQISDLRKKNERLQTSELSLSKEVASLRLQQEEIPKHGMDAQASHDSV